MDIEIVKRKSRRVRRPVKTKNQKKIRREKRENKKEREKRKKVKRKSKKYFVKFFFDFFSDSDTLYGMNGRDGVTLKLNSPPHQITQSSTPDNPILPPETL